MMIRVYIYIYIGGGCQFKLRQIVLSTTNCLSWIGNTDGCGNDGEVLVEKEKRIYEF